MDVFLKKKKKNRHVFVSFYFYTRLIVNLLYLYIYIKNVANCTTEKHVGIINFLREETKNLWIKGCIFEEKEKKWRYIRFTFLRV